MQLPLVKHDVSSGAATPKHAFTISASKTAWWTQRSYANRRSLILGQRTSDTTSTYTDALNVLYGLPAPCVSTAVLFLSVTDHLM